MCLIERPFLECDDRLVEIDSGHKRESYTGRRSSNIVWKVKVSVRELLRPVSGRPMLINLWASWCKPCLEELKEIAQAKDDIVAAGIAKVPVVLIGLVAIH